MIARDKVLNDLYGKVATDPITLCCFVYMDVDRDFLGNEVDEHFAYENEGENPFVPVKKADKHLLYWYK